MLFNKCYSSASVRYHFIGEIFMAYHKWGAIGNINLDYILYEKEGYYYLSHLSL